MFYLAIGIKNERTKLVVGMSDVVVVGCEESSLFIIYYVLTHSFIVTQFLMYQVTS